MGCSVLLPAHPVLEVNCVERLQLRLQGCGEELLLSSPSERNNSLWQQDLWLSELTAQPLGFCGVWRILPHLWMCFHIRIPSGSGWGGTERCRPPQNSPCFFPWMFPIQLHLEWEQMCTDTALRGSLTPLLLQRGVQQGCEGALSTSTLLCTPWSTLYPMEHTAGMLSLSSSLFICFLCAPAAQPAPSLHGAGNACLLCIHPLQPFLCPSELETTALPKSPTQRRVREGEGGGLRCNGICW